MEQPRITRRLATAGLLASAATATGCIHRATGAPHPFGEMKRHAEASGRFYGAAAEFSYFETDGRYRAAFEAECDYVTPEYSLKWDAVEPERGRLHFGGVDHLATFARRNDMKMYGHTLLWHKSVPTWADQLLREASDWQALELFFSSTIPRYGDIVDYWDVVNEPILTGHRYDGLRPSVFLEAFGPDYIKRALETARVFTPAGKLMINEFSLEYALTVEDHRRYHFIRLIERLRAQDAPLDGVGLQAHLDLRKGHVSPERIEQFLRELENFGLDIIVTELDVREADTGAPLEVRDRRVADEVRRYLDIVLQSKAVKGVITWGLSDRYSWLELTDDERGAAGEYLGSYFNRGLPLNSEMRQKDMHRAIVDAFAAATSRTGDG